MALVLEELINCLIAMDTIEYVCSKHYYDI